MAQEPLAAALVSEAAGDPPGEATSARSALRELEGHGPAARHAELVGTLAMFIAYLKENGILEDVEAHRGHHMLHRYAYIAQSLGMRLGYEFDFLETGAFSSDLEVDLFRLGKAGGGTEPFAGNERASAAFLDLVRGRDAKWLQVATFAIRERGRRGALEDFMAVPQGIVKHDGATAKDAFDAVERCVKEATGGMP